jgi:hypothetical protein
MGEEENIVERSICRMAVTYMMHATTMLMENDVTGINHLCVITRDDDSNFINRWFIVAAWIWRAFCNNPYCTISNLFLLEELQSLKKDASITVAFTQASLQSFYSVRRKVWISVQTEVKSISRIDDV